MGADEEGERDVNVLVTDTPTKAAPDHKGYEEGMAPMPFTLFGAVAEYLSAVGEERSA